MVIRDFWEKVTNGKPLKGDYESKSVVVYPNMGGWSSSRTFERGSMNKKGYEGFKTIEINGKLYEGYYFDCGTQFGIHSFQLISFEV